MKRSIKIIVLIMIASSMIYKNNTNNIYDSYGNRVFYSISNSIGDHPKRDQNSAKQSYPNKLIILNRSTRTKK